MIVERACTKQYTLRSHGDITQYLRHSLSFCAHFENVPDMQSYSLQSVLQIWPEWALLLWPALSPRLFNWRNTSEYNDDEKTKEICKKSMTGVAYFCAPEAIIVFLSGVNELLLASVRFQKIQFISRFPTASSNGSSPLNMPLQSGLDCSWWSSQTCKQNSDTNHNLWSSLYWHPAKVMLDKEPV